VLFWTHGHGTVQSGTSRLHAPRYGVDMVNPQDTLEERETRLQTKLTEYRAAEKRRLVKQGIALWTRSESEQLMAYDPKPRSRKVN
jgi:hypothetical protein